MRLISAIKKSGVFMYLLYLLPGMSACLAAHAQEYPTKPILFVIPFAAGGDSDLSGRNVGQHASKYLNSKLIIPFNRVGASGVIGAMSVKNADRKSVV